MNYVKNSNTTSNGEATVRLGLKSYPKPKPKLANLKYPDVESERGFVWERRV